MVVVVHVLLANSKIEIAILYVLFVQKELILLHSTQQHVNCVVQISFVQQVLL